MSKNDALRFPDHELTAQISLGPAHLQQFAKKLRRYVDNPPNKGDRTMFKVRLKQIVLNLLYNAIKFTPPMGQVKTSIFTEDGSAVLQISDTGIGIAQEDMPKVLAPFQQVRDDYTKTEEGTGLGVFLSNRLTELHGGTLSIESEVGKGTTVTVRFPPERTVSS